MSSDEGYEWTAKTHRTDSSKDDRGLATASRTSTDPWELNIEYR
jgi:hypothetical protein